MAGPTGSCTTGSESISTTRRGRRRVSETLCFSWGLGQAGQPLGEPRSLTGPPNYSWRLRSACGSPRLALSGWPQSSVPPGVLAWGVFPRHQDPRQTKVPGDREPDRMGCGLREGPPDPAHAGGQRLSQGTPTGTRPRGRAQLCPFPLRVSRALQRPWHPSLGRCTQTPDLRRCPGGGRRPFGARAEAPTPCAPCEACSPLRPPQLSPGSHVPVAHTSRCRRESSHTDVSLQRHLCSPIRLPPSTGSPTPRAPGTSVCRAPGSWPQPGVRPVTQTGRHTDSGPHASSAPPHTPLLGRGYGRPTSPRSTRGPSLPRP